MAEALPSLKARVVQSSAAVAALVGLLAAAAAVGLVLQQQRAFADRRLLEAGQLFAQELTTSRDSLARQVDDENAELGPLGMRLSLCEDGAPCLGGEAPEGLSEGCQTQASVRRCAVRLSARRVVVSSPQPVLPLGLALGAVLLASALSAVVGALVSRPVGTWALGSLLSLEQRVARASAEGPLELGPRASTAEVESLRAALDALVAQLHEALERSRVFASGAAHELRTPLATLSAQLELLAAGASEEAKEASAQGLRTLRRLSLLVDRLLALARGELGPARPFETVALEDIVRQTVASRSAVDRARLVLTVDDAGMLRGDEALLGAIVDNLVDNSLKFSDGAVALHVGCGASQVAFTVRDTGPGVPAASVAQLLKPFERGDTAVAGHGLGLAIVRRAVELHHGELAFEGSTQRVSFPRWSPAQG